MSQPVVPTRRINLMLGALVSSNARYAAGRDVSVRLDETEGYLGQRHHDRISIGRAYRKSIHGLAIAHTPGLDAIGAGCERGQPEPSGIPKINMQRSSRARARSECDRDLVEGSGFV